MEKRSVKFEPMGITCQLEAGESLFQAAVKAGVRISASCGGRETCGKCKIRILEGSTGEPTATERKLLGVDELNEGWRLSCLIRPQSDMVVEVPPEEGGHFDKKDMNQFPGDFSPQVTVEKVVLSVPSASLSDQHSHADRLLRMLECEKRGKADGFRMEFSALKHLEQAIKDGNGTVTAVLEGNRILDVEAGETFTQNFGIAFDIGTTTVVGLLWDLNKGKNITSRARTNPQSVHGADVISRIHYAGASEEHLQELSQRIRDCLNEIAAELCDEAGCSLSQVYKVTVVGNTAMSHLFMGVNPATLAKAPFAPAFCRATEFSARFLRMNVHSEATVYLLPNIAGHVGSDISALLINSRIHDKKGLSVAVDIGTNGEILLAKDGKVFACSTAAGPAFEGAEIHQGMRAAPGAISEVDISSGKLSLKTIEDARPVGICGSGLIDAVAQLLNVGLVDRRGRLLDADGAKAAGFSEDICWRLQKRDAGLAFVIFSADKDGDGEGGDVVLTQMDIRKVQLAKGAIAAGIRVMAKEAGADVADIESVALAGAFGNFVSRESVLRIGLLPGNLPVEKVVPIGNAAGAGASMVLLSGKEYELVKSLVEDVSHVELSANPVFQNEFIMTMGF